MKKIYAIYALLFLSASCSDFDEQDFTVLLPDAGEDQVVFTEVSGTTIQLDAAASSDVNGLGFNVMWELEESPEGIDVALDDPTSLSPTFQVTNETAGRFVWRLILTRGDQISQDVTRVDVNPANAQLLLVNAVDGLDSASLNVPAVELNGEPVAALSTDTTYYNVDLNIAQGSDGTVAIEVPYGDQTLALDANLEALRSYTLYVVGNSETPELLLVEKTLNQNTLPPTFIGLDAIMLSPGVDNVQLFIDATSIAFGVLPLDNLFIGLGLPDSFGILSYQENKEIIFPFTSVIPLPIWATVNGQRISNDAVIGLPNGVEGNFGTFVLFPDSNAEFGNTLTFINNSELLPQ
ncbi:MAG: hypothetical protein AAGC45_10610 [Bacteroidota bacterium]